MPAANRSKSLTARESVSDLSEAAEGATAPESLRQKDRAGFCDTLERAPAWTGAAEGVNGRLAHESSQVPVTEGASALPIGIALVEPLRGAKTSERHIQFR